MAAVGERRRIEVGLTAELHDALGEPVGVLELLGRVLEQLVGGDVCLQPARHEIVVPVTQHADELGRERLVQHLQHLLAVRPVALRHRAFLDMAARGFT